MIEPHVIRWGSVVEPRGTHARIWLAAAAALFVAGWGAQQFTPMLLVYHRALGVGTGTLEAMFGIYALGLIPAVLLAGHVSDVNGRRAVVLPAAALSLIASLVLIAGSSSVALLFIGRFLTGVSSGAIFTAGSAWLRELSAAGADERTAARRVAVAMTTGFALGPLVAGLLAQWVPDPRVVAYLPHILLTVVVLIALRRIPETLAERTPRRLQLAVPEVRSPRFRSVVAPMAPWVFALPSIAFALLPSVVGAARAGDGIAFTAMVTAVCALSGVVIQPVARRLDQRGNHTATVGLLVAAAGLALGALTAQLQHTWLLVPSAVVLGAGYGLCLVAGLTEVQRIADPLTLGGLTAAYYTLCYLGFAAPYLLALAAHVASYAILLLIVATLALASAALVARSGSRTVVESEISRFETRQA